MALSIVMALALAGSGADDKDLRPKISVNVNPTMGTNPVRVVASADLTGGADDYEEFYCPAIEWDWNDGTKSETSEDCDPYQEGTSEIRRRFSADHTFQQGGAYRVTFRLKQKTRVVASASSNVQVRAGVRDDFGR